jgi:hypothetical protein
MMIYIYGSTHYSFKGIRATSYYWVKKDENPSQNLLHLGDQIRIFREDQQMDGEGSFIRFFGGVLIWKDKKGLLRFQVMNDGISIQKIG